MELKEIEEKWDQMIFLHQELIKNISAKSCSKLKYQTMLHSLLKICPEAKLCSVCEEIYSLPKDMLTCDYFYGCTKFMICDPCQQKYQLVSDNKSTAKIKEFCDKFNLICLNWSECYGGKYHLIYQCKNHL